MVGYCKGEVSTRTASVPTTQTPTSKGCAVAGIATECLTGPPFSLPPRKDPLHRIVMILPPCIVDSSADEIIPLNFEGLTTGVKVWKEGPDRGGRIPPKTRNFCFFPTVQYPRLPVRLQYFVHHLLTKHRQSHAPGRRKRGYGKW